MSKRLFKSFKIYINSDTVKKNDKILLIPIFWVVINESQILKYVLKNST